MKNRSNTDTRSLCEFTLSVRIDPIAIDPIHFKLSFDTIYVIIGMLYHKSIDRVRILALFWPMGLYGTTKSSIQIDSFIIQTDSN